MTKNKKIITINGKDYTEDQFTDKQKVILSHLQNLNQKIASAQFNLDQLKVSKEAFTTMLKKEMEVINEDLRAE